MKNSSAYDVVIVGSGLGGLLSAVMLAKEGMKVCVLEKNKQYGGCLQTFSLQKHVFDSCVHYIGGLGEGHPLHQIFEYAGIMSQLELRAFDATGFDRICFGDQPTLYPLANGEANFIEQLSTFFPKEKEAIAQYIAAIKNVGDQFPLYRLRLGAAAEKQAVSGWELTQKIAQITSNKRLQQVLLGNNLLYAGVPQRTPFYLHALVTESYIHSAHKIVPGSSQISKFLIMALRQYGGEIYNHATVEKIAVENGAATYAETVDGQRFNARNFIANIHPAILLPMIDSTVIKTAYRKRISQLPQTTAPFMLNIVLRPATVKMRHYNTYWHQHEDALKAIQYMPGSFPETYAAYFTESKTHPGFAESVSILTYMHYEDVEPWANTCNHTLSIMDRGQSYIDFKERHAQELLAKVSQHIPEISANNMAHSVATPLTYRDYTATPTGAFYGILKDVNQPAATTIATRTKIPNLLLTGQNINLHGVLGVSITAVATCAELLGDSYLLQKIKQP